MSINNLKDQKEKLTPEEGFNLVGIDSFSQYKEQLFFIEHFGTYQDALKAKKARKNSDEYFILYQGPSGEYFSR